jgi:hypothetical protein
LNDNSILFIGENGVSEVIEIEGHPSIQVRVSQGKTCNFITMSWRTDIKGREGREKREKWKEMKT